MASQDDNSKKKQPTRRKAKPANADDQAPKPEDFDEIVFPTSKAREGGNKVKKLPMMPLRDIVLYPYTIIPLSVTGTKAIAAIERCMQQSRIIVVVAVRPENEKKKDSDLVITDLYEYGTTVLIHKMLRLPDGSVRLIVQGVDKVVIEAISQTSPFFIANVRSVDERERSTKKGQALIRNALSLLQKMINLVPYFPDEVQVTAMNMEDPVKLSYLLATFLRMNIEKRQEILESHGGEKKLTEVVSILRQELELLELGGKLQGEVKEKVGKQQRDYFLREQMRAIQKELGDIDDEQEEIKDLQKQVKKRKLSDEARKIAEKELKRLQRIPPAAGEYQVVHTYLKWILDMPWGKHTKDHLDLEQAQKILDEDHYDLKDIKERILEHLAVRKLKKNSRHTPILCFVGPPGVGKTSLGKSIARALGREFIRMSLGGVHDEAEIRGHRRTYIGALPGRILQQIARCGYDNPVFMLDEVDKIGSDFRGDPSSALLEVLDPEQNNSFRDHYLDIAYDLSKVFFITTVNELYPIQPALLDRMEIIRLSGYTAEEKFHIAKKYLIPRQVKDNGLKKTQVAFTDDGLQGIIENYTREAGVRNLEREIGKGCRKVAHNVAIGNKKKITITKKNLKTYLGPEKVFPELARKEKRPGVVTGLAWTATGGDVLFIEATSMPGKKNLILTGQLGDVMKESAQIALSYIRSKSKYLKIPKNFFEEHEIHLHVPAGSIPKDGPSAGITMATALASLVTGKPIDNDVAMTGELTLTGFVMPIGGLKEKILAARRAGIKKIIIPKKNQNDLEKIDDVLLEGLEIVKVEKMQDVLRQTLKD